MHLSDENINGVHLSHSRQVAHGIEIEIKISLLTKSGPQEGIYK
jgi:hypothetical protein